MELPKEGVELEYYALVDVVGTPFACILSDKAEYEVFPVDIIARMGWDLVLISDDTKQIVKDLGEVEFVTGPPFRLDSPKNPSVMMTHIFWTCNCKKGFIQHDSVKECPKCGAKGHQPRGIRYWENVSENIEVSADSAEVSAGMHTLH